MLATLIIVFREVMEAGLVAGIVLAATRGVPQRGRFVAYGIAGGVLLACVVAMFARTLGEAMEGFGQEYFNIGILSAAVLMLTWHNVWMARHGREIATEMRALGAEVASGNRTLTALAVVVGVAVLREGSEVVLFLYGVAISGQNSAASMLSGGALGLVLGVALACVTYLGLMRISNKNLFKVTTWMLALLAAGMATQIAFYLQQAQIVTVLGDVVWDSSAILADSSIAGKALHTLVGYTDRPTALQLLVYVAMLAVTAVLMRLFGHTPQPKLQATA
ncbi:MAG: FTR1 family protein [Rickettsiales bacterium]